MDNIRYITIPRLDTTQQMIDDCIETSFNSLRVSSHTLPLCILKYEEALGKPTSIAGYTDYSYEEILVILQTSEWNSEKN